MLADWPGPANGSVPSISSVGEPSMPRRAAWPSSLITSYETETSSRPRITAASRSSRTGSFGQSGTARTVRCIVFLFVGLPGHVPIEPREHGSDHRALIASHVS